MARAVFLVLDFIPVAAYLALVRFLVARESLPLLSSLAEGVTTSSAICRYISSGITMVVLDAFGVRNRQVHRLGSVLGMLLLLRPHCRRVEDALIHKPVRQYHYGIVQGEWFVGRQPGLNLGGGGDLNLYLLRKLSYILLKKRIRAVCLH